MFKNLKAAFRQWRRESVRQFLYESAEEHLRTRHQMCCYSFDLIAIDIAVDGGRDDASLQALLELVDLRGRNALDVGANIGVHSIALAEHAARVFAFEPQPKTYQLLDLNVSDLTNVTTFNLGASDRAETVKAVSPHLNFGATAITDRPPSELESAWSFEVVTLDSIAELKDIALFKLDVEGHEERALAGARDLLQREQPVVVLEQNADAIKEGTSASIELLKSLGYDHLYSLDAVLPWRTPQALPGPLRKLGRIMEALLFGPADWSPHVESVQLLQNRDYPMLIASTRPLPIDRVGSGG